MKFRHGLILFASAAALMLAGCTSRNASQNQTAEAAQTEENTAAESSEAAPETTPAPLEYTDIALNVSPEMVTFTDESSLDEYLAGLTSAGSGDTADFPVYTSQNNCGDYLCMEGNLLYVLKDKTLKIIRIDGENTQTISEVQVGMNWSSQESASGELWSGQEKIPSSVFASGEYVAVVSDRYSYTGGEENGSNTLSYQDFTSVDIYNVSDPQNPVLTQSLGQSGYVEFARCADGNLVIATRYDLPGEDSGSDPSAGIPSTYVYDTGTAITADRITAFKNGSNASYDVVGVYSLDSSGGMDCCAVLGADEGMVYDGSSLLFSASYELKTESRSYSMNGVDYTETALGDATDFAAVSVSSGKPEVKAVSTVPGAILSGSALSSTENGYLMLAETNCTWELTGSDNSSDVNSRESYSAVLLNSELQFAQMADIAEEGNPSCAAFSEQSAVIALDDADSTACLVQTSDSGLSVDVLQSVEYYGGNMFSCGDHELLFSGTAEEGLTLYVLNKQTDSAAAHAFGKDFGSSGITNKSVFIDSELDRVLLPANDSVCIYEVSSDDAVEFVQDLYLNDWAWNARVFKQGGSYMIVDKTEVQMYSASDFALLYSVEF